MRVDSPRSLWDSRVSSLRTFKSPTVPFSCFLNLISQVISIGVIYFLIGMNQRSGQWFDVRVHDPGRYVTRQAGEAVGLRYSPCLMGRLGGSAS